MNNLPPFSGGRGNNAQTVNQKLILMINPKSTQLILLKKLNKTVKKAVVKIPEAKIKLSSYWVSLTNLLPTLNSLLALMIFLPIAVKNTLPLEIKANINAIMAAIGIPLVNLFS